MRTYELMYVLDPRVGDEEADSIHETVKQLVTDGGTAITKEDDWGRRKLAYEIDKQTEGRYRLLYFHADEAFSNGAELDRRMEQSDKVLRHLVIRTDQDLKRAHGEVTPELAAGMNGDDETEEEEG